MTDDADRTIKCADCGKDFVLTVAEQQSFAKAGLHQPKRCRDCRRQRRIDRERQDQQRG